MIEARILLDSINSYNGQRITTWILKYPRFILAEFNTHRALSRNSASCLHGSSMISFDLPTSKARNKARIFKMSIEELYRKWSFGDSFGRTMRNRLKNMNIRCLNEKTQEFTHAKIKNVMYSGQKDVYQITLKNGKTLKCSSLHRIFTDSGWKTLDDLGLKRSKNNVISWNNTNIKIATNGLNLSVDWLTKQKKQGKTLREIAKENNISEKALRYFAEKNKVSFRKVVHTPNESFEYLDKDWLLEQKNNGLTNGRIAEICNSTEDRIKHACQKLGVNGFIGTVLKGNKRRQPWNFGKKYKHSPEVLQEWKSNPKMWRSGEKSSSWKGGPEKYQDLNARLTKWLKDIRLEVMEKFDWKCAITGASSKLQLHHIDPVWHNKEQAFNIDNIIPLTKEVHKELHSRNLDLIFLEWFNQGKDLKTFLQHNHITIKGSDIKKPRGTGRKMICRFSEIDNVKFVGTTDVYDIEIDGEFHNFVADDVVVHNSRAIPVKKMIERVKNEPAMPIYWGKNQSGMQAAEELDEESIENIKEIWLAARDKAVEAVEKLSHLNLHKQVANRLLEPFMYIETLMTATDMENFFALRAEYNAQPEFRDLAFKMLELYNNNAPTPVATGDWHIPFGDQHCEGLSHENKLKVATARAARVSYLNFEGHIDHEKDYKLHDDLLAAGHCCYDNQTEVLTSEGWTTWDKVKKTDSLASVNIENGEIVFERPLKLHKSRFNGEMIRLKGQQIDLLVTPNHNMVVQKRTSVNNQSVWLDFGLERADSLLLSSRKYMKAGDLVTRRVYNNPFNIDTITFSRMLGFFIGDGDVRSRNIIGFNLRLTRKIDYLNNIGMPVRLVGKRHVIDCPNIGQWMLDNCFDSEGNKKLPDGMLMITSDEVEALLDGLKNSDGSIKRETWCYCTTSEILLDQIQALSHINNLVSSISKTKRELPQKDSYRINFSNRIHPEVSVNQNGRSNSYSYEQIEYDDYVYCATVSTGALLVRRNKKVVVCGNSPFEHTAKAQERPIRSGNFFGWTQYRKLLTNECRSDSRVVKHD